MACRLMQVAVGEGANNSVGILELGYEPQYAMLGSSYETWHEEASLDQHITTAVSSKSRKDTCLILLIKVSSLTEA